MENLEIEYKGLQERFDLISAVLNAKVVENDSTKYLEQFKSLMNNDFKSFTRGESTMSEDAIAISKLYEVLNELTDSVRFPMISTKIIVAVAGGFSSGKSKFLNTIIHNENVKLSTGIKPVTAIPTFIQQSKTSSITSFSPDGRQGEIPVNLFNKIDHNFLEKLNINLKNIMPYVTVNTSFIEKCSELKNICFIDTPGYDAGKTAETEEDKNVAFDALEKAVSVLWFVDIDNGTLHKNDVAFLTKLNEKNSKKIFIVVTKADKKKSQIQNIINKIKEDLDENDIKIEGISAYSSNEKKEYLDEDGGKSVFEFLNEQDKNIVDTAKKVEHLIEKVEEVFDMYYNSINEDNKQNKEKKKAIEKVMLHIEEVIQKKDSKIDELNIRRNYYDDDDDDYTYYDDDDDYDYNDDSFDSSMLLELVEDRSKTNRKNLEESKRICNEMITCIKNLFKTLNPNLQLQPRKKKAVKKPSKETAKKSISSKKKKTSSPEYLSPPTPIDIPTAKPVAGTDFVEISAGKMNLAADGSYEVTITRAFQICDHEVTQKEWQDVMGDNPSYFSSIRAKGETQKLRPVENVNWYRAIAYCNERTKKEKIKIGTSKKIDYVYFSNKALTKAYTISDASCETVPYMKIDAKGYRLPTEAEWEIAARGGVVGNCYAGTADESELGQYAWYTANSKSKTHEVKKKRPNGYGLYDMSGNVWEWCWDRYDISAYTGEATDPTGPGSGSFRVYRGGSCDNVAFYCRAFSRSGWDANARSRHLGFRLVRSAQ